jgi:hypothetical protein
MSRPSWALLPEQIQTLYQSAIMGVSMSKQPGETQSTSHLEIIFENPTHITAE